MRFVFRPPADVAAGLLSLPWHLPLEEWQDDRLVEIRNRGTSRHVVRFVAEMGQLYALKEIQEVLARREYRLFPRAWGAERAIDASLGTQQLPGAHELAELARGDAQVQGITACHQAQLVHGEAV